MSKTNFFRGRFDESMVVVPLVLVMLLSVSPAAIAQEAAPALTGGLAQIDFWVKIVGAVIAALAALLGIPIVFLTYRKTRAEITKLEIESRNLQRDVQARADPGGGDGDAINISVRESPGATIVVTADPKLVAPLLIVMDFLFAFIALQLTNYLLSIFDMPFTSLFMFGLGVVLLLPIARQVLHMRVVVFRDDSNEESPALLRRVREVVKGIYLLFSLLTLAAGALLLGFEREQNLVIQVLGWLGLVFGLLLVAGFPVLSKRFSSYLDSLTTLR